MTDKELSIVLNHEDTTLYKELMTNEVFWLLREFEKNNTPDLYKALSFYKLGYLRATDKRKAKTK